MPPQTKRRLLIALIAAIGFAVFVIVVSFLLNERFYFRFRFTEDFICLCILATIAFATFTALDHPRWKYLAVLGIASAILTMITFPLLMLLNANPEWYTYAFNDKRITENWHETVKCLVGTSITLTGLLCFAAFTLAPKLPTFGRFAQYATVLCQSLVFVCLQIIIWQDRSFFNSTNAEKAFVLLLILAATGTIAITLFNKFRSMKTKTLVSYTSTTLRSQCPRCQTFQDLPQGESACRSCNLKFKIDIEEPVCPKCSYNLHKLTSPRCPECGTVITISPSPQTPSTHCSS